MSAPSAYWPRTVDDGGPPVEAGGGRAETGFRGAGAIQVGTSMLLPF
jgi:hypothetical protein